MPQKKLDLSLPEWVTFDSHTHLGDPLAERLVFLHVRTHTILEAFALDDTELHLNPKIKTRYFTYKNSYGITENHCLAVHYSLTEFTDLEEVLDKAVIFYCDYLAWEDTNIEKTDTSKIN